MRNGIIRFAIAWFSFQLAPAKDFQKSYTLPPETQINIQNYLGSIKLTSYKGKTVELTAYKKGPDGDSIEIGEDRGKDWINIFSRIPPPPPPKVFGPPSIFGAPKQFPSPKPFSTPAAPVLPGSFGASRASVDFEIRVPESIEYKQIVLLSGSKVDVSEVKGHFILMSGMGSVEVKNVAGWVIARSNSGNVSVYLANANEPRFMEFSSINGNVTVRAPENLSAAIDMHSQGGFKTDFALKIDYDRYGSGISARGRLGTGRDNLRIYSNTGKVSLLKEPSKDSK
jgi:hypothetical protein